MTAQRCRVSGSAYLSAGREDHNHRAATSSAPSASLADLVPENRCRHRTAWIKCRTAKYSATRNHALQRRSESPHAIVAFKRSEEDSMSPRLSQLLFLLVLKRTISARASLQAAYIRSDFPESAASLRATAAACGAYLCSSEAARRKTQLNSTPDGTMQILLLPIAYINASSMRGKPCMSRALINPPLFAEHKAVCRHGKFSASAIPMQSTRQIPMGA